MSISKRGKIYHFRFVVDGVEYSGPTGENTEREAKAFEARLKKGIVQLHSLNCCYEKFRQGVLGIEPIKLAEAWDKYMAKPGRRDTEKTRAFASHWRDWAEFVSDNYPDVKTLDKVTAGMAEEYIGFTERRGRWDKRTAASGKHLANATLNDIRATIFRVFEDLKEDAGLSTNPFAKIKRLKNGQEGREAFSPEELRVIGEKSQETPWVRHIFFVGAYTGLREGDICMMKWEDIKGDWIERKTLKTGKQVEIPIMPALQEYLAGLPRSGEYVFPELAERYSSPSKRGNIGKGISHFLTKTCGIATHRQVDGRSRAIVLKDVHSLRHTFAYMASLAGIPLPVVQGVVGHMSPEMTKRYIDHASRDAKRVHLEKMPNYLLGE